MAQVIDRLERLARASRLAPWLLLVFLVSACQVDAAVKVEVEEDGSGVVEVRAVLDAETTDALLELDLEGAGIALTDLAQSGWVVSRPETQDNGSTVIVATKPFGTPEQFGEVMGELNGPDGPFRDFVLLRRQRFAQVDYDIEGTLDTSGGLESFGDTDLETALGQPLEAIASRYGVRPEDVGLSIELAVPGQARDEPPAGVIETEESELRALWPATMADNDVTPIVFRSSTRQVAALVLRGVAVLTGVLALIVLFAQVLGILRPDRRRKPSPRRANDIRARRPVVTPQPVPEDLVGDVAQRVLALDGMGVLYREADDVGKVLIPFARDQGSRTPDEEIEARVRALRLGRLTTGEFWRAIGVAGDPDALDTAYLSRHQLTPGVIKYLRAQRDRGLRVACITNDSPTWAFKLRAGHSLEGLIDPWVISGSVGVGKPARPIFEVLRRVTGEPPSAILVIDDDLDILDAARALGFATMWFAPSGERSQARGHRLLRGFDLAAQVAVTAPASEDLAGRE